MRTKQSFAGHYDDFYDGSADFTAWRAAGAQEKADNIVGLWTRGGVESKPTVLDIGCGNGVIAEQLIARGFTDRLVGYDVSSSGIAEANARGLQGAQFHVINGPIPAQDRKFDLAVLSHVVEHVDEPRTILREAARLASQVVVEVPLEHHLRNRGDFEWTDVGHVNFYSMTLIRKLMQSSGIAVTAQLVTPPGRVWAETRGDRQALLRWRVKDTALRLGGPVSRNLMTFHGTLLGVSEE